MKLMVCLAFGPRETVVGIGEGGHNTLLNLDAESTKLVLSVVPSFVIEILDMAIVVYATITY